MEEDSGATEWNLCGRNSRYWDGGCAKKLPAGLDYQDHAGMEDGDVAVAALEGGDGGLVGGGNGVESLATFHGVVQDGLSGSTFAGSIFVGRSVPGLG